MAGAGDVNGDGIDDVVIGAYFADPNGKSFAGQSYVVFGSKLGFPPTLELSLLDGKNGFRLNGVHVNDTSGGSVAGAGDVNGDGINDVMIAATKSQLDLFSPTEQRYVVFGTNQGFPQNFELSALNGDNGVVINGIDLGEGLEQRVAGAGDVNGDGVEDVIIGARFADSGDLISNGRSYIVFGLPALDLVVSGSCPGTIGIDIAGASSGGSVKIGSAPNRGNFTLGLGACAGTETDLDTPQLEGTVTADFSGHISLNTVVTSESCLRFVQLIDWATCLTSNLARLP